MEGVTYLLPIKSTRPPDRELGEYLRHLSRRVPVVVVDGSEPGIFACADRAWSGFVTHVHP